MYRFISFSTTLLLTLFSQVMVNVQFPYVVYRKGAGLQIRTFALFKLFPVGFYSNREYFYKVLMSVQLKPILGAFDNFDNVGHMRYFDSNKCFGRRTSS